MELNESLSLLLPAPPQYACMPVRKMVTGTRACRTDSDCAVHSSAASVCVTPSLENQTRFIRVTHPPNTHMLFVGYPPHLQYAGTYRRGRRLSSPVTYALGCCWDAELSPSLFCLSSVSLTNFVPRFGFLHLDLPIFLETFFKYPSA